MPLFTSDRLELALNKVSTAIVSDLISTSPRDELLKFGVLHNLEKLENRPWCLTEMAYRWCALVWENRETCWGWESFLLLSLKVGFRHLAPALLKSRTGTLTHTENHRELVETVFKSNDSEAIADLLRAFTTTDERRRPVYTMLDVCTRYIIELHNRVAVPFSPRLRQHVVRYIEFVGYRRFEEEGAERFVELLNHLHVGIKDMDYQHKWGTILLGVAGSSNAVQHLAIQSWELLVELKISSPWMPEDVMRSPHVMDTLLASQQWDKLECWIGVLWMTSQVPDDMVGKLESETVSLFRRRPGAVQKLTEWMERYWVKKRDEDVPGSLEQICKRVHARPT